VPTKVIAILTAPVFDPKILLSLENRIVPNLLKLVLQKLKLQNSAQLFIIV